MGQDHTPLIVSTCNFSEVSQVCCVHFILIDTLVLTIIRKKNWLKNSNNSPVICVKGFGLKSEVMFKCQQENPNSKQNEN